ncbi:MAG: hypothetical protein A2268_07420 [Candidatus Raymondbacteria bacterium RifOxyA12_full_50_37]|uniref:Uncharacterized protein n=1 Tax=Candidatus Raymondbacteria bacterium RIFOXYD12_FULL_49_13 TaxID=1817890 RepID=A0A1F7F6E0_UNCRA|nr:MAG: hypothetical protein A2350_09205 [Candidatus Raymondbacteria bacterium RifOxyB12_full_50_8]OGJ89803.1 MAG: hypothetical protein A2268_07420 [Candidatus Raymondbacteria bacterium RifOxyA12_full_50_37]OGJ91211.1 MAG: hypothetical protein A2248_01565 [Candidatus Raymondbacteria bacterium RIFOXYA2_FULL_49_16]OGJ96153.1 MAG: hypothetical protein A2487_01550 [Candidatus Raymondbacteria bacterium RifOxyC12_full_50_8]OGJ97609.1 MAG: hypothetical protein A2453_02330 [Candidatus Raymondbacteria b
MKSRNVSSIAETRTVFVDLKWIKGILFGILFMFIVPLALSCSKETSGTFNPADHYLKIEELRAAKPLDLHKIESIYTTQLAPRYHTAYPAIHASILEAMRKGEAGENVRVQSQTISKELQKIFYRELAASLSALEAEADPAMYAQELERAKSAYACLKPLSKRRSEWLKNGTAFDDLFASAFSTLASMPGKETVKKTCDRIILLFRDIFIYSVFYELFGIETSRGTDNITCEEKMAEARIFLESALPFCRQQQFCVPLATAFHKDYRDLDIEKTREDLFAAFPGLDTHAVLKASGK